MEGFPLTHRGGRESPPRWATFTIWSVIAIPADTVTGGVHGECKPP